MALIGRGQSDARRPETSGILLNCKLQEKLILFSLSKHPPFYTQAWGLLVIWRGQVSLIRGVSLAQGYVKAPRAGAQCSCGSKSVVVLLLVSVAVTCALGTEAPGREPFASNANTNEKGLELEKVCFRLEYGWQRAGGKEVKNDSKGRWDFE